MVLRQKADELVDYTNSYTLSFLGNPGGMKKKAPVNIFAARKRICKNFQAYSVIQAFLFPGINKKIHHFLAFEYSKQRGMVNKISKC